LNVRSQELNRNGSASISSGKGWGRRFLLAFLVVAFCFQGFVAQSHIHSWRFGPRIAAAGSDILHHSDAVFDQDSTGCLLCAAVAQAGAFSTPIPAGFALPVLLPLGPVGILSAQIAMPSFVGHGWRQRAPPRS